MSRRAAPAQRNIDVLHAIVQAYIETGEPVASRTVARHYGTRLSAASIRNIMADLCDEGYLSQPHTSAGRERDHAQRQIIGTSSRGQDGNAKNKQAQQQVIQVAVDSQNESKDAQTGASGCRCGNAIVSSQWRNGYTPPRVFVK